MRRTILLCTAILVSFGHQARPQEAAPSPTSRALFDQLRSRGELISGKWTIEFAQAWSEADAEEPWMVEAGRVSLWRPREKWIRRRCRTEFLSQGSVAEAIASDVWPSSLVSEVTEKVGPTIDVYDGGRHLTMEPIVSHRRWEGTLHADLDRFMRRGCLNGVLFFWEDWWIDQAEDWRLERVWAGPGETVRWMFIGTGDRGRVAVHRLETEGKDLLPVRHIMTKVSADLENQVVSGADDFDALLSVEPAESRVLEFRVLETCAVGGGRMPSKCQMRFDWQAKTRFVAWLRYAAVPAPGYSPSDFDPRVPPEELDGMPAKVFDELTGALIRWGVPPGEEEQEPMEALPTGSEAESSYWLAGLLALTAAVVVLVLRRRKGRRS